MVEIHKCLTLNMIHNNDTNLSYTNLITLCKHITLTVKYFSDQLYFFIQENLDKNKEDG